MLCEKVATSRLTKRGREEIYTETVDATYRTVGMVARFCKVIRTINDESTTTHVIFRRSDFIALARSYPWTDRSFRKVLRDMIHEPGTHVPGLWTSHYGGPGEAFCNRPFRVRTSRKFVVFRQRSGIDV